MDNDHAYSDPYPEDRTERPKEKASRILGTPFKHQQENTMSNVYMVCAVRAANEAEARNGKSDTLVGELKAVVATSENGASAKYAQMYLKDVDLDGVEVKVKNF